MQKTAQETKRVTNVLESIKQMNVERRKINCVNCMFKIKSYNLKIKDEHDALDPECPTYKRAIEEEKRRGGWEVKKK